MPSILYQTTQRGWSILHIAIIESAFFWGVMCLCCSCCGWGVGWGGVGGLEWDRNNEEKEWGWW